MRWTLHALHKEVLEHLLTSDSCPIVQGGSSADLDSLP